jgi:hypothetical protein
VFTVFVVEDVFFVGREAGERCHVEDAVALGYACSSASGLVLEDCMYVCVYVCVCMDTTANII